MSIRLGMIGTGRIAARAVAEIREVKKLELTAVMNPNREHAAVFASKHGIPEVYDEIQDLAGSADAVYIASPHATHYGYSQELLSAGVPVLCEKPLAFRRSEAEELYGLASSKGLAFMEAVKTAYCPGFRKIEEVITGGAVGDVVDVEAAFTRLTQPGCREYTDCLYGGAFTEFGTYPMLPIFRFLGTEYRDVRFSSRKAGDVDGYTKAFFEYGDRFGCAKAGLTVKSEGQLLISGTKGYLIVPSPWWLTKYFEVRYEDPRKIDRYECEFAGDGLRYEFAEFAARIEGTISEDVLRREKAEAAARAGVYERFLGEERKHDR